MGYRIIKLVNETRGGQEVPINAGDASWIPTLTQKGQNTIERMERYFNGANAYADELAFYAAANLHLSVAKQEKVWLYVQRVDGNAFLRSRVHGGMCQTGTHIEKIVSSIVDIEHDWDWQDEVENTLSFTVANGGFTNANVDTGLPVLPTIICSSALSGTTNTLCVYRSTNVKLSATDAVDLIAGSPAAFISGNLRVSGTTNTIVPVANMNVTLAELSGIKCSSFDLYARCTSVTGVGEICGSAFLWRRAKAGSIHLGRYRHIEGQTGFQAKLHSLAYDATFGCTLNDFWFIPAADNQACVFMDAGFNDTNPLTWDQQDVAWASTGIVPTAGNMELMPGSNTIGAAHLDASGGGTTLTLKYRGRWPSV